jgi:hypothetical protein
MFEVSIQYARTAIQGDVWNLIPRYTDSMKGSVSEKKKEQNVPDVLLLAVMLSGCEDNF